MYDQDEGHRLGPRFALRERQIWTGYHEEKLGDQKDGMWRAGIGVGAGFGRGLCG